jgi:molecular chaperone HtpG
MSVETKQETYSFQTEVNQLLQLMIHSLYSNKEIFLRELISNASDAIDKLRFEALSNDGLYAGDSDLKVRVSFDAEAKTITVEDNGIGMTREEVIDNLGTIARSGTKEFIASLTGDQAKDAHLIGQFGVGFYSSFIVSQKVDVLTRRAGAKAEDAVLWSSTGNGEYNLADTTKSSRGTSIVLHLKDDEQELLDHWRLRSIITKYSDHIAVPVVMDKVEQAESNTDKEGEDSSKEVEASKVVEETINRAKALWTLAKSNISEEEYHELYKHVSHDFESPLCYAHNKVEGSLEYISLLYIPARAPFDLWNRDNQHGLKLYVQRVFIMDEAEQFLPQYLRFAKGIIDSNDLPLNISREILQNNKTIDKMRVALTKRILGMLEDLAKTDAEKYATFWSQFGQVLKEGPAEDITHRDRISALLRFATTHDDRSIQAHSFADYVQRMHEGQDAIYYVTADTFDAAKNSPHLEVFRKKGIEVLLLNDRVDEWLVSHLSEFDGKKLCSVAKGDLDLGELEDKESKAEQEKASTTFESVIKQMKEVLADQVKDVRVTLRLTQSPSCVVVDENEMGAHMQRLMQAAGQNVGASKPILEINPEHALIQKLSQLQDDDLFAQWSHLLLEQALLAEGGQIDNPAAFVQRINRLLEAQ